MCGAKVKGLSSSPPRYVSCLIHYISVPFMIEHRFLKILVLVNSTASVLWTTIANLFLTSSQALALVMLVLILSSSWSSLSSYMMKVVLSAKPIAFTPYGISISKNESQTIFQKNGPRNDLWSSPRLISVLIVHPSRSKQMVIS